MSKTACIVPWSNFVVGPDGRTSFCCEIPAALTVGGRIGSVYRDSLDDLWNAREIVEVRTSMAKGERPEACSICWNREAAGDVSRRLLMNTAYRQLGGRLAIEELPREGATSGYRLERRPDWFILELGNICNLKCRSCNPLSSSRIAADPIHDAWTSNEAALTPVPKSTRRQIRRLMPENTTAWFDDVDSMADMIAGGANGNAMLSLIGGEPFLTDSTWRVLSALVERGVAPRLFVGLLTNGQQRSTKLQELVPHFRGFNLSVSIDGHGKLYEYLRHGASWRKLVDNLSWFSQVPNLDVTALPTLQNGNAIDMVPLLRFLDEQELRLAYNVVNLPARLRSTNLPPSVRRIAVARLRHYLDTECKPANMAVIRGYCENLESAGDDFDASLFDEFMTFTNDLDADRGESLPEVAPELVTLIRAAGIEWSDAQRHVTSGGGGGSTIREAEVLQGLNRTISSRDVIFNGFDAADPGSYFRSGPAQLAQIDARLRECGHPGLAGLKAVADFGCHYGRTTRSLVAALPHAAVYSCDIDREAVQFCADELGALPVVTGWCPDEECLPCDLDAVVCVSLLTHTPIEHWRRTLRAWFRMLRPGGVAAFTYLSENYIDDWLAGAMENYGSYSVEQRASTIRSLHEQGHGFAALTSEYGGEPFYGIAFSRADIVRQEIAEAGFELLALPAEASLTFGQDLALVRKPGSQTAAQPTAPVVARDVSVVAFYDPRCYAPAVDEEDTTSSSVWAQLAAAQPPRPLPTELGFGDPRVPEVREAQASLAREHGVDAFCYLYLWGATGPRWDAPWRDLITTGRPDFPFCLMVQIEDGELISVEVAARLFDDIAAALHDNSYLSVDGRKLLIVRDISRFGELPAIAKQWRASAASRGLGELHLCAAEPAPADCPQDIGFDSFLQTPAHAADYAGVAAAALTHPWPRHRFFRAVQCHRNNANPHTGELYEHWLRLAVDATRRRDEKLVFVDAWNDWLRGRYLEPDDRDGRAALLATRRAVRGPASGLVLLRQLRDALGEVEPSAATVLEELEQVLGLHEHTRDRLLASVEAALGRNHPEPQRYETGRWVPVSSRQLPPSGSGFSLDHVGNVRGPDLWGAQQPISLSGEIVNMMGWAHSGTWAADEVDLFLALESFTGNLDRIVRVPDRIARPDVVEVFPGYPANCGFDTMVNLVGLPPGIYRVAIVQRTPHGTYRDATPVDIEINGERCSNA